jgi:ABC-type proline/glycine betaine transport system permease subunit
MNSEKFIQILERIETYFNTLTFLKYLFFLVFALLIEIFFIISLYNSQGECTIINGHFNGMCMLLILSPTAWASALTKFASVTLPLFFIVIITSKRITKKESGEVTEIK